MATLGPLGFNKRTLLPVVFFLILVSVACLATFGDAGWDAAIYHKAMLSMKAGHDPYADAIAIQKQYHLQHLQNPKADPPYSYVYSPITLPLLRLIATLPTGVSAVLYWSAYAVGVLALLWVGVQFLQPSERRYLLYFVPVSIFFPGLLANATVLSGNIAFILYALVFTAAVHGWKRDRWGWFYLAVIAASCVKFPLITLVVIPLLSARKQWTPAASATAVSVMLFAGQPLLWPSLFRHYLEAVQLQFTFNRDFGCSPAGLFSGVLYDHGRPYTPANLIFFAAYALPLLMCLFFLSRSYLRGHLTIEQWAPVLLVGVILLNPRLIEYDTAPIALPLAVIAWRMLAASLARRQAAIYAAVVFLVANGFSLYSWELRKLIDGPLLVLFFVAGSVHLLREAQSHEATDMSFEPVPQGIQFQ